MARQADDHAVCWGLASAVSSTRRASDDALICWGARPWNLP